MNSNVKSFLADLKQVNDNNTISIKVPSTKKKASFKRFNVTQQKKLLRSAFDGVQGTIDSVNVFNSIIKDNCESEVDFLLCDRSSILLELRKVSVGPNFEINGTSYDLNELKPFDIKDVELTTTIENSGIEVTAHIPTLDTDTKINTKMIAELGKLTEEQQRKQSIELVLIYEIIKFIDTIKLGDAVVKFDDISVYERVSVVNELPLALNNAIIDYITRTKKVEEDALTFEDGATVEIDAGFLAAD